MLSGQREKSQIVYLSTGNPPLPLSEQSKIPPQYWSGTKVLAESLPTDVAQRIGHDSPPP